MTCELHCNDDSAWLKYGLSTATHGPAPRETIDAKTSPAIGSGSMSQNPSNSVRLWIVGAATCLYPGSWFPCPKSRMLKYQNVPSAKSTDYHGGGPSRRNTRSICCSRCCRQTRTGVRRASSRSPAARARPSPLAPPAVPPRPTPVLLQATTLSPKLHKNNDN